MTEWLEPLGLLIGDEASDAVAAGMAHPLAGGPLAFSMVRRSAGVRPVADLDPALLGMLITPPLPWAGLPQQPAIMGVLNITPDSFSDGGVHLDPARAIASGQAMIAAGADLLDIGGESTRPGSSPTSPEEEQDRILPVIAGLALAGVPLSIDTRNARTMALALDAGAHIINDVSGLTHDPAAAPLVAARGCPVIIMHMRGTPATMVAQAVYQDAPSEVLTELAGRVAAAVEAGIQRAQIAVDPGIGFAKAADHSIALLQRLPIFTQLGCRIVVGVSRKRFVGGLSGASDPAQRDAASVAAGLFALARGANVLRVHNVADTVRAVRVWQALAGYVTQDA